MGGVVVLRWIVGCDLEPFVLFNDLAVYKHYLKKLEMKITTNIAFFAGLIVRGGSVFSKAV